MTRSSRVPALLASIAVIAVLLGTTRTYAVDGGGIDTVFAIRKSSNDNTVNYGIRLDADCHPRTEDPIVTYFHRGEGSTRELSMIERSIYGVRGQRITSTETGGSVDFRLRAVSDRTIRIATARGANGCTARAITRVNGERAVLVDIFVVLDGPRSVDHVEVTGRTIAGARTIQEHIRQ